MLAAVSLLHRSRPTCCLPAYLRKESVRAESPHPIARLVLNRPRSAAEGAAAPPPCRMNKSRLGQQQRCDAARRRGGARFLLCAIPTRSIFYVGLIGLWDDLTRRHFFFLSVAIAPRQAGGCFLPSQPTFALRGDFPKCLPQLWDPKIMFRVLRHLFIELLILNFG